MRAISQMPVLSTFIFVLTLSTSSPLVSCSAAASQCHHLFLSVSVGRYCILSQFSFLPSFMFTFEGNLFLRVSLLPVPGVKEDGKKRDPENGFDLKVQVLKQ